MKAAALALLVLVVSARSAASHPMDTGYLRIDVTDTTAAAELDLDVAALATLVSVPHDTIDAGYVRTNALSIGAATLLAASVNAGATPCTWTATTARLEARTVRIASVARCATGTPTTLALPFLASRGMPAGFQLLVKHGDGLVVVDRSAPTITLTATPTAHASTGLLHFIGMGIEHIGAAPSEWRDRDGNTQLPDGIDHILFVLALLLGGGTLRRLAMVATGFTVGHSITLALAAFGVLQIPTWFVEPVIALSIAFVAVEAITQRLDRHRWKLALGFGLIHGFGFANALTELELPTRALVTALVGYNIGVELGQLAIIIALAPIVLYAHRRPTLRRWAIYPAATAIGIAGMFWFVERVASNLG